MAVHLLMPAVAELLMAARLLVRIPARSAASVTEATRGHSLLAAGRASAEASMVGEASMVEEVTDEIDASTIPKSIEGA
jgi:hypothetical protein